MGWFQKKPVSVEARQLTGDNCAALANWINDRGGNATVAIHANSHVAIEIDTLEGTMTAGPSDWIIHGTHGEFYPCKDEIFRDNYEQVVGR